MSGVARKTCKTQYNTPNYWLLFEGLQYLVEFEGRIDAKLGQNEKKSLTQDVYDAIDLLDMELKAEPEDVNIEAQDSRTTSYSNPKSVHSDS